MIFIPLTTAHGALGIWDEALPIALAVIFTLVVVVVLWRSRRFRPEHEDSASPPDEPT